MKPKYLLFGSFGFFILLQFLFSLGIAPLSDDLVHYADVVKLREGKLSEMDIFRDLFSDPNRYARPMSPLVLGAMMVLSQYASLLFFLWGVFFVIPAYLLYKIINKYFGNEWIALLVSVLVLLFPLSSSNHFSHVMQSGLFIIICFLSSVLLTDKKKIYHHCIIGILSLLSLLLYEGNLFLFPLLVLLIWINNKEKKYLKIFLAIILPVTLAFLYKKFGVKIFFPEHFDYASEKVLLTIDNIKKTPFALIKLFSIDTIYILYRGFEMVKYYSYTDFALWGVGAIISALISIYIEMHTRIKKRIFFIALCIFCLTSIVFFVSIYSPTAFTFGNRILLWIRFSSMLLLACMISNVLFWSKDRKILNIGSRLFLFIVLFSFFTSFISQKNSWIAASDYNKNLIRNLEQKIPYNQEKALVITVIDKKLKNNFITDETTLEADWEIEPSVYLYTKAHFKRGNLAIFNPTDYALYKIRNKENHKRPKTKYKLTENGIEIGEKYFSYPFFIYDERDDSIIKVNNQQEFKIK